MNSESLTFEDDLEEMMFEAANWLRMAISLDENLPEANFILGIFYEQGYSVEQNHNTAFSYYEKAALAGHS